MTFSKSHCVSDNVTSQTNFFLFEAKQNYLKQIKIKIFKNVFVTKESA